MYPDYDEIIIEEIRPYVFKKEIDGKYSLQKAKMKEFLADPLSAVFIRDMGPVIKIYSLESESPGIAHFASMKFQKRTTWTKSELFEDLTTILFGLANSPDFKVLLKTLKGSISDEYQLYRFMCKCLSLSLARLDSAEEVLKEMETKGKSTPTMLKNVFRWINDSSICFLFMNKLLPDGYGLRYIKLTFGEMRGNLTLDFPKFAELAKNNSELRNGGMKSLKKSNPKKYLMLVNLASFYRHMLNEQNISKELDHHRRRSQLWSRGAKVFTSMTNRKVSEFLGQHGSGYKLEKFLDNLPSSANGD